MRAFSKLPAGTIRRRPRCRAWPVLSELALPGILVGGVIAASVVLGELEIRERPANRLSETTELQNRASIYQMSVSERSGAVLVLTHQRHLVFRDLETGQPLDLPGVAHSGISAAQQSADGSTVVAGYDDGSLAIARVDTAGRTLVRPRIHADAVWRVAVSPNGLMAASTGGGDGIRIWDVSAGRIVHHLKGPEPWIRQIIFSPDGRRLLVLSTDSELFVYDVRTATVRRTLRGPGPKITCLACSPHEQDALLVGCIDGSVRRVDVATGRELWTLSTGRGWILAVVSSPDGGTIACGGFGGSIHLWNARTLRQIATLAGHRRDVRRLQFSPDGARLYSAGYDGTVRTWDTQCLAEIRCFGEPLR